MILQYAFRVPCNLRHFARHISITRAINHNPLGLPQNNRLPPPKVPTRGGSIPKRGIPHAKRVIAVSSGKGGVGKSTVAVNLALALARYVTNDEGYPLRVGLLDLDIFGPSIPKLMGLESLDEPPLTKAGALVPLANHGLQCMSMGFLIPPTSGKNNEDTAIVWRGLMVQKATQQLLFDVDWRGAEGSGHPGLDVVVIDMPPGTGDVQLTLGQLVNVDGAVVVSTPQDVALVDARKGVTMFKKVDVPILGLLLNMSHYTCSNCDAPHYIFGTTTSFHKAATDLSLDVLGELPLVPLVSAGGDTGKPFLLSPAAVGDNQASGARELSLTMEKVARRIWQKVESSAS